MMPRIIHQIWIGGEVPPEIVQLMHTVRTAHPNWEYMLWTDENLPDIENLDAFRAARTMAMKADILRLELLWRYGGVYVDADFSCHHPLDQLFPRTADLRLVSEFGVVCNGLMGSSVENYFIGRLVEQISHLESSAFATDTPQHVTGPYFMERMFVKYELALNDPGCLLPGDFFFAPRTRERTAIQEAQRKRYLTHAGMATWRRKDLRHRLRGTKLRTRARRFLDLSAE
jgi:inositol phosphorylceramide mannosyltransferase catalytic subunit